MNFKRIGKCPNCGVIWQCAAGAFTDWKPRCIFCSGVLVKYDVPQPERATVIADHTERGKHTVYRRRNDKLN